MNTMESFVDMSDMTDMTDMTDIPDNLSDPQDSVRADSPDMSTIPMTPTPTNPGVTNLTNTRRPPRKSTLTQQQKNQKRQRATQDQLITLEVEFNKNPTPTAMVRERIAQNINMTERSVQIWFQNRRAKIKNIARKSVENGEECEDIPESMRRHLALSGVDSMGNMFPGLPGGMPMGSFENGSSFIHSDTAGGKVVIQHFNCRSLSIGSWRRVGQSQMDLIIFYSPEKACVTYYINNDSAGYKIEYPFAWIKSINLVQNDDLEECDELASQTAFLLVELNRPPKFYMDGSGAGGFYECSDFTEDMQASRVLVHKLGGPSKVLSNQLAKLVSLDTFQNRHLLNAAFPISAPVSPIGNRPASQPNHLVHPHAQTQQFAEAIGLPPGNMGPPAPRGHKRQRSRSVPVAMDFSMFRQPVAPFLIQQQQHVQSGRQTPTISENAIFAPIPQHISGHSNFTGSTDSVGPGLSIDTTATYNMDFRGLAGPMTGTTLPSPSEFGTPGMYNTNQNPHRLMVQHPFSTPIAGGFLDVDPSAMIGTSNTPLSFIAGDPVIAEHSPPFDGIDRDQSVDIFSTPGDHQSLNDDSLSLDMTKSLNYKSPLSDYSTVYNPAVFSDEAFSFSPQPAHGKMDLPLRAHDNLTFHTPTHNGTQLMQQQDSGVSFTSPLDSSMFHTPKEHSSLLYQDGHIFNSLSHMQGKPQQAFRTPMNHYQHRFEPPGSHMQTGVGPFNQSPLSRTTDTNDDLDDHDIHKFIDFGTVDPAAP